MYFRPNLLKTFSVLEEPALENQALVGYYCLLETILNL